MIFHRWWPISSSKTRYFRLSKAFPPMSSESLNVLTHFFEIERIAEYDECSFGGEASVGSGGDPHRGRHRGGRFARKRSGAFLIVCLGWG